MIIFALLFPGLEFQKLSRTTPRSFLNSAIWVGSYHLWANSMMLKFPSGLLISNFILKFSGSADVVSASVIYEVVKQIKLPSM